MPMECAAHRAPKIIGSVDGVGWVLDPNHDWRATHPIWVPRPSYHLSAPYICPRAQEEVSASKATRERKRQRKWEQHADATDPELVKILRAAYQTIMALASCKLFFAATDLPRACCSAAQEAKDARGLENGPAHMLPVAWRNGPTAANQTGPLLLDPAARAADSDESANDRFNLEADQDGGRLLVVAPGEHNVQLVLSDQAYRLPPNCAVYVGDAAPGLCCLEAESYSYSLIVINPPWPSKSRGAYYRSMTIAELCALKVGRLLPVRGRCVRRNARGGLGGRNV